MLLPLAAAPWRSGYERSWPPGLDIKLQFRSWQSSHYYYQGRLAPPLAWMHIAAEIMNACLIAAVEIREQWPPLWVIELAGKVLLLAWLFAVGSSVGSFLNVVAYRLPAGVNLVHPGSRCPRCLSPIRLWHNIPILGWFLLRGRCRDCRLPISPRYPLVEFLVATAFVVIAWIELFTERTSVAAPLEEMVRPLLHVRDGFPFWLAYVTHVTLVTTLLGAALLEYDRERVPWRLYLPVLLLGLIAPLFWPEIRRVPAGFDVQTAPRQAGLADGLAGLALGAALGCVISAMWHAGSWLRGWPRFAPIPLAASIGLILGWQRLLQVVPPILLVFVVLMALQRVARSSLVIPLAGLLIFSVAPALMEIDSELDFMLIRIAHMPVARTLAIAFVVALLSAVGGAIAPRQYFASTPMAPPAELVPTTTEP